jgi:hypothetical protein
MYKSNAQSISRAVEKMKNKQLLIEEVLDDEDIVNDLRSPSFSQVISFIDQDKMEKLMDYMLNEPVEDADQRVGHKFPYFACEILCSENVFLLEKYFDDINKVEEVKDDREDSLNGHQDDNIESNTKQSMKEKYLDENKHNENEEDIQEEIKLEDVHEDKDHTETPIESTNKTDDKNQTENHVETTNQSETTKIETTEQHQQSSPKKEENVEEKIETKEADKDKDFKIYEINHDDKDICENLEDHSNRKRTVSINIEQVKYLFKILRKNQNIQ